MTMDEIFTWMKENDLWGMVGYRLTHQEFDAQIWTHLYKLKRMRAISWWGVGKTPLAALEQAYEKAKEGLPNIPKTEAELDKRIYYGKS